MIMVIPIRHYFLLCMSLILVLTACKRDKADLTAKANAPRALEVRGVVVVPRELNNNLLTTGTILANDEVEIRTEVPGRIISINFEEGSYVNRGDLLVKINDTELQAQLKAGEVPACQDGDLCTIHGADRAALGKPGRVYFFLHADRPHAANRPGEDRICHP
jgi:multidrug efflux pump subunit AcrA (membrane-fusion protein)